MNEQLRRIQFVTQYYDWLQGLRFLPMGLAMLGFAGWLATAPSTGGKPSGGAVVLASGLTVALGLYPVIGRYYRQRFGDVRPSAATKQTRRTMMVTFLLAGLAISQGMLLLHKRGANEPLPVVHGLVLFAVALVAYWAWTGRFVRHYLAVAGVMCGAAVLQYLGLNPLYSLMNAVDTESIRRCDIVTLHAVSGLGLVSLSVLDHRLLVRTLRPALPDEDTPESPSEPDEGRREAAG